LFLIRTRTGQYRTLPP